MQNMKYKTERDKNKIEKNNVKTFEWSLYKGLSVQVCFQTHLKSI